MAKISIKIPPPGGVSYRYEVIFTAPVKFADTITTQLKVIEKVSKEYVKIFSLFPILTQNS